MSAVHRLGVEDEADEAAEDDEEEEEAAAAEDEDEEEEEEEEVSAFTFITYTVSCFLPKKNRIQQQIDRSKQRTSL
jgi:hypothetical protein